MCMHALIDQAQDKPKQKRYYRNMKVKFKKTMNHNCQKAAEAPGHNAFYKYIAPRFKLFQNFPEYSIKKIKIKECS